MKTIFACRYTNNCRTHSFGQKMMAFTSVGSSWFYIVNVSSILLLSMTRIFDFSNFSEIFIFIFLANFKRKNSIRKQQWHTHKKLDINGSRNSLLLKVVEIESIYCIESMLQFDVWILKCNRCSFCFSFVQRHTRKKKTHLN